MEALLEWFLSLGDEYGVNPWIFGSIYVGAVPFFWLTIYWLIQNARKKKSVIPPILGACLCASSAYIYLIIVGQNVPTWVYGLIVAMIVLAIWSTINKMKKKLKEVEVIEK